jgi:DsbC/DsbD-like thiol-disulfide interchange protein
MRVLRVIAVILHAALAFAALAGPLSAGEETERSRVDLLDGGTWVTAEQIAVAAGEGTARLAGLQIRLTPGWYTYWRNPGESGLPSNFDWSASKNVEHIEVLWPAPGIYTIPGSSFYGYKEEVILPLLVYPGDPSLPLSLAGNLDYAICNDELCVPRKVMLHIDIPASDVPEARPEKAKIWKYMQRVPPRDPSVHGLRIEAAESAAFEGTQTLTLLVSSREPIAHPLEVMIDAPVPLASGAAVPVYSADRHSAVVHVPLREPGPMPVLTGHDVYIVVRDGERLVGQYVNVTGVGSSARVSTMMDVRLPPPVSPAHPPPPAPMARPTGPVMTVMPPNRPVRSPDRPIHAPDRPTRSR